MVCAACDLLLDLVVCFFSETVTNSVNELDAFSSTTRSDNASNFYQVPEKGGW